MLAGALATARDHGTAFADYERGTRGFVEQNQALVADGDALLFPTVEALARRDALLRQGSVTPQAAGRPEHSALTLPAFAVAA